MYKANEIYNDETFERAREEAIKNNYSTTVKSNELVLFSDGSTASWREVTYQFPYGFYNHEKFPRWREMPIELFSNEIIEKPRKKSTRKKQTDITKMREIEVDHETEKAYAIYAGDNGSIVHPRSFYEYVAKSVCIVEDGKVYAPHWAVHTRF